MPSNDFLALPPKLKNRQHTSSRMLAKKKQMGIPKLTLSQCKCKIARNFRKQNTLILLIFSFSKLTHPFVFNSIQK